MNDASVPAGDAASRAGVPAVGPLFFGSDIYRRSSYGAHHPLRIARVSTVIDLSRALGWLSPATYRTAPIARPKALALWHDPAYLEALQRAEATGEVSADIRHRHGLGTVSNPVFAEMYRRPATGAGAAMLAAELLAGAATGRMFVPGGGTHHGLRDRANGFCYLNDPVLAILVLLRSGLRRVAYVDLDAHHCDGVAQAFSTDPRVLMVSVHEEARWPFTGALTETGVGNAFNLPVPRGLNDSEMAVIAERLILPRVADFAPDSVVLQCGADSLAEDPLSRLALSNRAYGAVLAGAIPLAPRLLMLGGGGYNPWSVGRLWTMLWGMMAGQGDCDSLSGPLPSVAQDVLRALSWGGSGRSQPDPALLSTLVDAPRPGPVRQDIIDRLALLAARPKA